MRRSMAPCVSGAGSTSFSADNVYELEYQRFRNTDMVGDAHQHRWQWIDGRCHGDECPEHLADLPGPVPVPRVETGGTVFVHTVFFSRCTKAQHILQCVTESARRWFCSSPTSKSR